MDKFQQFLISPELSGLRLDKALAGHPEVKTRSQASKLIAEGLVRLNGKPVKASHLTISGEIFEIVIRDFQPLNLTPYNFPLEIVFEDEDLIVVNKPAGLVVHPSLGHSQNTLVNALLHHTKNLSDGFHEYRPGIVHRLDRETSGLLVVAKNNDVHRSLADQFRSRTIHRLYWALVYGRPARAQGTLVSYLARHPTNRKKFASLKAADPSLSKGKRAVTHYSLKTALPCGVSWLLCKLETGRTHQIRVHLSELGNSILGDQLYTRRGREQVIKSLRLRDQIADLKRIGLVATELGFHHPRTNQLLEFRVGWPEDLKDIVRELKINEL